MTSHQSPTQRRGRHPLSAALIGALLVMGAAAGASAQPAPVQPVGLAGAAVAQVPDQGDPPAEVGGGSEGSRARVDKIGPALAERLEQAGERELIPIVIRLADPLDLATLVEHLPDGERRRTDDGDGVNVVEELTTVNEERRRSIVGLLRWWESQGNSTTITPLWIINGLATEARPAVIEWLARRRDVIAIDLDAPIATSQSHGGNVEPNIDLVGAHGYWDLGYTGQGVTTGFIDSGADLNAGEIGATWRGGTNSWIDFVGGSSSPIDPLDSLGTPHGTVAISVAHGDDRSGSAIGMAPGARWIAARVFDQQRSATISDVHAAFQWMLDPDGNPATDDGPRIVNNSWVISSGTCDLEFEADIQALVAAGILPVVAAGNQGTTSGGASPGNYADALAVGAVDNDDALWDNAPFGASNQGPTDCGTTGQNRTFPDLTAPGVSILTAEGLQFYFVRSGTSVAAPHVTGAAALLLSEFPGLTVAELRAALESGAVDLGPVGADNAFGNGRLDVLAARATLAKASIGGLVWSDLDGDGTLDDGEPALEGVTVELFGPGQDGTIGTGDDVLLDSTSTDIIGQYILEGLDAGTYRLDVDDATTPAGSTLTTGNDPVDVTVSSGQIRTDLDIGFAPPAPASITGLVWNDSDGDGTADGSEDRLVGTRVMLVGTGPDGSFGTNDDTVETDAFTDDDGAYLLSGLPAGSHLVQIDTSTLPEGSVSTTGGDARPVTLTAGQDVGGIDFGYDVPAESEIIYLSFDRDGTFVGGTAYADEDIVAWDGTSASIFFDGSDLGMGPVDLDAVQVIGTDQVAFSIDVDVQHPLLGSIDDSDILLFTGSTGPNTSGTVEFYFDGSDVGLTSNGEDVIGIDILGDGTILLTTLGNVRVPGLARFTNKDVLAFAPATLGPDTSGLWALWSDGSDVGLDANSENLNAIDSGGVDLTVSTRGAMTVDDLTLTDHDLSLCSAWVPGTETECLWSQLLAGQDIGLRRSADIDAVTVRLDTPAQAGGDGPAINRSP